MHHPVPRTLSELLHVVVSAWPHARVLALTSAGTGVPTLRGLDLAVLPTFRSLRYEVLPGLAPGDVSLPDEAEQLGRLADEAASYDVVLLDPFHTLVSSRRGLAAALAAAAPRSMVLVHDCRPPVELRGEPFRPGAWCGRTDEAFLEACLDGDRAWFTVDSDFGLGVLGPAGSRLPASADERAAEAEWHAAALDDRGELLERLGPLLLHLVRPEDVTARLDPLLEAALGDRRRVGVPAYRSPVDDLRAEVASLRAQVAAAAAREQATAEHCATELRAARDEADAAREQLDLMRGSPSMRVGRAVTAPVRLVRSRSRRPPS